MVCSLSAFFIKWDAGFGLLYISSNVKDQEKNSENRKTP
jgi:hypothetical protein